MRLWRHADQLTLGKDFQNNNNDIYLKSNIEL